MARVSIYLNFPGNTEAAFTFYAAAFDSTIATLSRFSDLPGGGGVPEHEQSAVLNVQLEILGGTVLMGTDVLASTGMTLTPGNNVSINLECDDLAQAERLFTRLSDGARESVALAPMPWGLHWGTCVDRFGLRWMFSAPLD